MGSFFAVLLINPVLDLGSGMTKTSAAQTRQVTPATKAGQLVYSSAATTEEARRELMRAVKEHSPVKKYLLRM